MKTVDRREFLTRGAAFAGAGLFGGGALETLVNRRALATPLRAASSPYGPVVPTADPASGREILALPPGFRYTTFGAIGSTMSDNVTPLALDGMAAFPHPEDRRLVRLPRRWTRRTTCA